MRLEVTLKVQFGAQPGQPADVLDAAFLRGISGLKTGIGHRIEPGPVGTTLNVFPHATCVSSSRVALRGE